MLRPVHDLEHLVESSGFWVALVLAAVGCGAVWVGLRAGTRTPDVALVAVVAGLVGLGVADQLPVALVVGLALLAGGELLAGDEGWCRRTLWLVAGAVVVGASLPAGWPFWMRAVAAAVAALGGSLTVATNRAAPRVTPALFAISAVGIYFCVPDTESAAVLVGALVVGAAWIFVPRARAAVGVSALTGLLAWVAADGGVGRAGSVVGGVACLGVLLLPIARASPMTRPLPPRGWRLVTLLGVQAALVAYESRVAGAEAGGGAALALSVPAFALAAAALLLLDRRRAPGS